MQERYLEALEEWLRLGKPHIQQQIAESVSIDPPTVSVWNRKSEFRAAVDAIVLAITPRLVERAHHGLLRFAERGNVLAYNAVMDRLERHGRLTTVAGASGSGDAVHDVAGTHVHIHQVPERQAFNTLPPPRVLPAPPATPTQGAVIP